MNRKHELFLINLGLETLLDRSVPQKKVVVKEKKVNKRKWSKERHKKFAETMAKKFKK
jgi:hypothetical protein